MIGIYKITNKLNGKIYVGQSKDIQRRWQRHKSPANFIAPTTRLYQAMKEDGLDNFVFEVIEECPISELDIREQYWIDYHYSYIEQYGYNMNKVDRPQYTINEDIAKQIIQDLKFSELSQEQLSKKYNVSHSLISQINTGKMWVNSDITYPIRNNGSIIKQNTCVDCGIPIGYQSCRCQKCQKKHMQQHIYDTVSREELKDKIRYETFADLARKYSTSPRSISRWCKFYNLPSTKKERNKFLFKFRMGKDIIHPVGERSDYKQRMPLDLYKDVYVTKVQKELIFDSSAILFRKYL